MTNNQNKKQNNVVTAYSDFIEKTWFNETPVSMKQFLSDPEYLGNATHNGADVYPYWKNSLDDIGRENSKYIVVLTGGIGSGKTRTAVAAACYMMHRILCLKDPFKFFQKMTGGQFAIVFFNLTKNLSEGTGYKLMQSWLSHSPWFKRHGIVSGSEDDPKIEFPIFRFKHASPQAQGFGFIGEDVIIAIMDEVDNPIASEKQKIKVISAYNAAMRRFENRFVIDGESLGKFFILASKQEKLSFLNTYIIEMKDNKHVYIKDDPVWDILPAHRFCGEKFFISLGDVYTPPIVLPDEAAIKEANRKGFKILPVPIEYKFDFNKDIVGALRDFAGISITHLRSNKLFSSEEVILRCYDRTEDGKFLPSSETKTTIEVGLNDDIDLANFINFGQITTNPGVPRYIHIDIAFTGDALGIAMSHISGWTKDSYKNPDGTMIVIKKPVARTDFKLRLKARPGDQIPIHKVHKLVIDLSEIYRFNVQLTTFDLRLASATSMQTLTLAGKKNEYLSMDKNPGFYREFRDVVNEGRWESRYDPYLQFELANLEDDPQKNMVDHPTKVEDIEFLQDGSTREIVMDGSKDKSDAVAGSVISALRNCKEPPNVELMKKIFQKAIDPTIESPAIQNAWILPQKAKDEKPDEVKEPTKTDIFTQIMKKALE